MQKNIVMEKLKPQTETGSEATPEKISHYYRPGWPLPGIRKSGNISNTSGATNRGLRGVTNKAMSFPHKNNLPPCAAAEVPTTNPIATVLTKNTTGSLNSRPRQNQYSKGQKNTKGPRITLYDNEKYCAFARFCDAYGRIWNLVLDTDSPEAQKIIEHKRTIALPDVW